MRDLSERATQTDGPSALEEVVKVAIERIPEARWASMVFLRATLGGASEVSASRPRSASAA